MIFSRGFTLFPQIFKKGLKRSTEQKNVYFKELTVREKTNQALKTTELFSMITDIYEQNNISIAVKEKNKIEYNIYQEKNAIDLRG